MIAVQAELERGDRFDPPRLTTGAARLTKMHGSRKPPRKKGGLFGALMSLVQLVPGVGTIAGAVFNGVRAVRAAIAGDWEAVAQSLLDALPTGVLGAAGKILDVARGVYAKAKQAAHLVKRAMTGDLGAVVTGALDLADTSGQAEVSGLPSDVRRFQSAVRAGAPGTRRGPRG